MGLESLQSLHLVVLSSCQKTGYGRSYFRSRTNQALVHRSRLFGCSNLKSLGLKRSCSAGFNEFFGEDFSKQIEELAQKFDVMDDNDNNNMDTAYAVSEISSTSTGDDGKNSKNVDDSSMSFLPSKLEFLEPNLLGIQPEPPEWPEREQIIRISIELRANSVDIPLSLRMIKRKQKWQKGFVDAGDFAYCSVKKAFSSMVLIIRELQAHALYIRESLHSEDLRGVMSKVQMEMSASFVWLFQQVFSRTPTLMVYVMLLLANFTVHSMVGNIDVAATPLPRTYNGVTSTTEEMNREQSSPDYSIGNNNVSEGKVGQIQSGSELVVPDEIVEVSLPGNREITQEEEVGLWNSMAEESSKMQAESRYEVLDHETMQQLVPSIRVELEPDDYEEYYRTDLLYQMGIAEDPRNPLLLSNYAQFLCLVPHDYDRAEECFKRAIMVEPPDAEALSHYADFLWIVRKDLWSAEERYQQAMAAEPNNHYHASKYANFLWSTGGEETCFPLSASTDNNNTVL